MIHETNKCEKKEGKRMRKHWGKKAIAYVLTLCMVASLLVGLPPMEVKAVTASGTLGGGITWSLSEDGTMTITGSGATPDYGRDKYDNPPPWKDYSTQIKKVTIGEGITKIGECSFFTYSNTNSYLFTNLKSINLPKSLTSIGKYAFQGCTGITEVTFPENLMSIGEAAFQECTGITKVTLPEGFTSIGNLAFFDCRGIETVTLPTSLTEIGEGAFGKCLSLCEVICKPTTPPTLNDSRYYPVFQNAGFVTQNSKGIKVPTASRDQYISEWAKYQKYIEGVNFHTHNWVYATNGNVISVYCNSEEGKEDCEAYGAANAKTLTLSAPSDLTYNGQPKAAHATDDLSVLTGATVGNINYVGVSPTVYEKSETAPTDAGTYKATLTVTAASGSQYTAEQEFTIEKADATCNVTANTLTYNGNEQELVTSTINGCTGYYRIGENGDWSTDVPKAKGAGTYEIYYYGEVDSNYNSVGSEGSPIGPVSVTIAKKALNAEMITINPASKVFDGEPTTPVVTVSDMNETTQCITAADYEISGADTQEEVGDYTIIVTAKDNGNYSGSAQKIWRITGATFGDNDITVTPYEDVYDGEAHGINIALSGDAEGAEITYCETESGTYTTTKPTYKDVKTTDGGTYTVYYKVNRRGYYEKKGSSTVKINPKEVGIEWTHTDDLVYNAAEQKPTATATGLIAGDTCNVTVTGGQTNSNKKAGNVSYTATADSLDNANYKLPETKPTTAFTIAPLEIGIAWGNASFTYNGSKQKPAATATGLVVGDSCILTVGGEQKDVGSYTATVTALDNDNYQLPSEKTTDFTISPKALTAETVTVSVTGGDNGENTSSFIWDGSYKKPTITVTDNETGENVTLTEDTDYIVKGKTEEVDVNPAGSPYKITLTGKGNYTGKRAVTWTIVKKSITPVVTIEGWTYGETPKAPALSGMTLMGDVTYTYYTDAECTEKTTTAANGAEEEGGVPTFAGTYYVKAVVAETDNYDETASAAASFTIAKKAVTVTPKADQKKTYGDRDPVFTYDVQLLEGDTLSGKLSRVEGEDAGTYKIKKGTLVNANYDITVDETVDFTIEPKKLTADMISMSPLSYPYDGSKKTATYAYHDDTVEVDDTGVTASDVTYKGDLTGTLCGQYTVKIVGQRNYTGTISKSWFISPVTDVTVDYDGEAHRIECANNLTGVSVKFYNEETKAYDIALEEFESLPSYTMPGVYEYKYRMVVDEGTDFEETADGTALLTINKSTMENVTVSIASSIGYGKPVAPSVLSKGEPITGVEVTYYYKKQSEEDSAYTTTVPTDKGDYTVKAVISESEYWAGATATANFSIIPGTLDRFDPGIGYYRPTDSGEKTVSLWLDYKMLDGVSYEVFSFDDKCIIVSVSVLPD